MGIGERRNNHPNRMELFLMSTKPPQKRAVILDPDTFALLEQFAKDRGVPMSHAANCYINAGFQSTETTVRAEALIEQLEPEPFAR